MQIINYFTFTKSKQNNHYFFVFQYLFFCMNEEAKAGSPAGGPNSTIFLTELNSESNV